MWLSLHSVENGPDEQSGVMCGVTESVYLGEPRRAPRGSELDGIPGRSLPGGGPYGSAPRKQWENRARLVRISNRITFR